MDLQTLPEAARVCGRSAREIRLLIEGGHLPAVCERGRWLVSPGDLTQFDKPRLVTAEAPDPSPSSAPAYELTIALTAELRDTKAELEAARERIHELEQSDFGRALRGSGERGALTPLFRPTVDR